LSFSRLILPTADDVNSVRPSQHPTLYTALRSRRRTATTISVTLAISCYAVRTNLYSILRLIRSDSSRVDSPASKRQKQ